MLLIVSPFLFSMFLNDIEDVFMNKGLSGIDVKFFKICLILYADDIVIFAESKDELQKSLDALLEYCNHWKLVVNTRKTKIMIFKKSGRLPNNTVFNFDNVEIEIVKNFTYLGIVFSTGGSFSEAQSVLSGQALKAIFQMNEYLHRFLFVQHRLDLFEKLITPILNYGSQVWGFAQGAGIERVHLQFCK